MISDRLSGIRIGRPTKAPKPGERIQIGVQVSPELKRRLEAEGKRNHRSLSREAEYRLERSFESERLDRLEAKLDAILKALRG